MVKNSSRYKLFKSTKRGSEEVENKIADMIDQMQTPENLNKLVNAISLDRWKTPGSARGKMDFSKFEEKLNRAKSEYFCAKPSDSREDTKE